MRLDQVRDIVARHARLSVDPASLTASTDLYEAGLSSLTTVNLMLALEDAFEVEFPERLLSRRTFGSIQSIADAIDELLG